MPIMKATTKHSNPERFKHILKRAEESKEGYIVVGYPSGEGSLEAPHYTSRRADGSTSSGISIKHLAAVHNNGATIQHPGGQPFFKNKKGEIVYASKSGPRAAKMAKTKPHSIKIPAHHFMEAAKPAIRERVRELNEEYIKTVNDGKSTSVRHHMESAVGQAARDCIIKAIDALDSPISDAKRKSGYTKPLVVSGDMRRGVTFQWRENT